MDKSKNRRALSILAWVCVLVMRSKTCCHATVISMAGISAFFMSRQYAKSFLFETQISIANGRVAADVLSL